MTDHHQWSLLGWLLLVWLTLGCIRVMTDPEPQRLPSMLRVGPSLAAPSVRTAVPGPTLVHPIQAKADDPPFTTPKNIFAPLEPPAETRTHRSADTQGRTPGDSQPTAPPSTPGPMTPSALPLRSPKESASQRLRQQQEEARQRMAQYRLLGYLSRDGEQRIFLQKGQEIYILRAGELAEGYIQVMTIDSAAVRLKETVTGLEMSLALMKREDGTF